MEMEIDRERENKRKRERRGRERVITKNWLIQLRGLVRAGDQEGKIMSKLEPHRFGVSELRESLSPVSKV